MNIHGILLFRLFVRFVFFFSSCSCYIYLVGKTALTNKFGSSSFIGQRKEKATIGAELHSILASLPDGRNVAIHVRTFCFLNLFDCTRFRCKLEIFSSFC